MTDVPEQKPVVFDMDRLELVLNAPFDHFKKPGAVVTSGTGGEHIYIDNGASILAVAHLDTVQHANYFDIVDRGKDGCIIYSPSVDDRLGAYIILDILPKLGVNIDILFTDGEEIGRSTAANFTAPEGKSYNWMFQFDRAGDDVVMYQYDTPANRALLVAAGLKPGNGSFTDICKLDKLGVSGFNFGTGYANNHSVWAYFDLGVCIDMIEGFLKFYHANKDTRLVHESKPAVTSHTYDVYDHYSPHSYGSHWQNSDKREGSTVRYGNGHKERWNISQGKWERWDEQKKTWYFPDAPRKDTKPNAKPGAIQVKKPGTDEWLTFDTFDEYKAWRDKEDGNKQPTPPHCYTCKKEVGITDRALNCFDDTGLCLECYSEVYEALYDEADWPHKNGNEQQVASLLRRLREDPEDLTVNGDPLLLEAGDGSDTCDQCGMTIDMKTEHSVDCFLEQGVCLDCFAKLCGVSWEKYLSEADGGL